MLTRIVNLIRMHLIFLNHGGGRLSKIIFTFNIFRRLVVNRINCLGASNMFALLILFVSRQSFNLLILPLFEVLLDKVIILVVVHPLVTFWVNRPGSLPFPAFLSSLL